MLLTFNTRNYIGDGCGQRSDAGLSYYGLEVVDRMNKIGMLIDVSHCGDATSLEAIDASKDPVLINHGGARALCPQIKRLKTDECIKALAEKEGLFGIYAVPLGLLVVLQLLIRAVVDIHAHPAVILHSSSSQCLDLTRRPMIPWDRKFDRKRTYLQTEAARET